LQSEDRVDEPKVDRWGGMGQETVTDDDREITSVDIFRLSAGVMTPQTRTSNRIDGLLSHMLEKPSSSRYVSDVDKNLDYLFTHLQLDMLERIGRDVSSRSQASDDSGIRIVRRED